MSRFDEAIDVIIGRLVNPYKVNDAVQYLRDLKASHEELLKSFKSRVDYCEDDRCRACEREQEIIKAAEALK